MTNREHDSVTAIPGNFGDITPRVYEIAGAMVMRKCVGYRVEFNAIVTYAQLI